MIIDNVVVRLYSSIVFFLVLFNEIVQDAIAPDQTAVHQ